MNNCYLKRKTCIKYKALYRPSLPRNLLLQGNNQPGANWPNQFFIFEVKEYTTIVYQPDDIKKVKRIGSVTARKLPNPHFPIY